MRCFRIAVHVSQALRHDTGYPQRMDWVSTQWEAFWPMGRTASNVPTRRHLRRSNPQGREARRSSGRAAPIRADHQLEDHQALGLTIPKSLLVRADEIIR